ncbi:hypothetical protein Tco_1236234, partial [Tanacetum coccineum]
MAERLQSEEQEKYTIEKKARMLAEMITERKRFFAAQRAVEIRSRPPTKTQVSCFIPMDLNDKEKEVEVDDEAELKMHMEIVKDDDIVIDVIPHANKPLGIVEYKLIREGIMGHYELIRANGSSKRYSSMIRML